MYIHQLNRRFYSLNFNDRFSTKGPFWLIFKWDAETVMRGSFRSGYLDISGGKRGYDIYHCLGKFASLDLLNDEARKLYKVKNEQIFERVQEISCSEIERGFLTDVQYIYYEWKNPNKA